MFTQTVNQTVEDALYEQRLSDALSASRKDFEEGNFYSSREDLLAAVEEKREVLHATA